MKEGRKDYMKEGVNVGRKGRRNEGQMKLRRVRRKDVNLRRCETTPANPVFYDVTK